MPAPEFIPPQSIEAVPKPPIPTKSIKPKPGSLEADMIAMLTKPVTDPDQTLAALAKSQKTPETVQFKTPPKPETVTAVAAQIGKLQMQLEQRGMSDAVRGKIKAQLAQLQEEFKILAGEVRGLKTTADLEGPKNTQKEPEAKKQLSPEEELRVRSENIQKLVAYIREGKGDKITQAKELLGRWLKQREETYFLVATMFNPDIQKVEGREHTYRVGERVYGSVVALLDATPLLESHADLAKAIQVPKSKEAASLMGEEVPPKAMIESSIVISGSSAENRIQPFGADLDMAEHLTITAANLEESGQILAREIQAGTLEHQSIVDAGGNKIDLHFTGLKTGSKYPDDVIPPELKGKFIKWNIAEVRKGAKTYSTAAGEKTITLAQECQHPTFLKTDYIGVTDDTVLEVTKVSSVIFKDQQGSQIADFTGGQTGIFQEAYFDGVPDEGLADVRDPDRFVDYVTCMGEEVCHYSDPKAQNPIKVAKRMYNMLKTVGDVSLAQELSPLFRSDAAAIYQIADRLGMTVMRKDDGLDLQPQKAKMVERLRILLEGQTDPGGKAVLQLLDKSEPDIGAIRAGAAQIINTAAEEFFVDNPRLDSVRRKIIAEYQPH